MISNTNYNNGSGGGGGGGVRSGGVRCRGGGDTCAMKGWRREVKGENGRWKWMPLNGTSAS